MRTLFCFFLLLFLGYQAAAQNKIFGNVTDVTTGEPIPFASVFFANTTFGASTDQNGNYTFSGFPPGKYDLSVSFVGYNPAQRAVEFTQNQTVQIDIKLEQQTTVLSTVEVKPDTLHWKRNYEDFKRLFLGTSRYAKEAIIQNPKDIHLYFDPQTSLLVAHTKKPIVIDNQSTGYRIIYYLYHFEYNARTSLFTIYGLPQFEVLTPKNSAQQKRWERNRFEIYHGSLLHFMRSWQQQRWKEEGFTVARNYRIVNKQRPSDEFINKKIAEWRKNLSTSSGTVKISFGDSKGKTDSLAYYYRLRNQPKEVDSVAKEILSGAEFIEGDNKDFRSFTGMLQVNYKENEDPLYAASVGRAGKITKQRSLVQVLKPLTLYSNGYYEDVRDVFLEQYWSWSEKISTLLPLDYQPIKNK